jgi:lipopolysaccharide export system protein LptA
MSGFEVSGFARLLFACSLAAACAAAAAESVSFTADSVQSSLAKDKERTVLSGRAIVKTGSITITADRVELYGKDYIYLDCSGSVKVVDVERKIHLEAPTLFYDRSKKLTRAQGPSVLQDDKNKLVLKAEWIENDGESEITLAQVAVRIVKDKLACRAEYALYRRNDNALELSGSPSAYKEGDEYKASRILVNTETEEISLEGGVSGSVIDKSASAKGAKGGTSAPDAKPESEAPSTPVIPPATQSREGGP